MATKKPRKKVAGNPTERLMRKMTSRVLSRNIKLRAEIAAEDTEIARLNNLPLGDPEHASRLMLTYNPIINWLNDVESTGVRDCTAKGVSIIHAPDHPAGEQWFQLDSALIAVADTFELIAIDKGIPDEGKGLRQVGKKVEADMLLFESDIAAARKSIEWMVEITKTLSPLEMQEYTTTISIRAHLALSKPELIAA